LLRVFYLALLIYVFCVEINLDNKCCFSFLCFHSCKAKHFWFELSRDGEGVYFHFIIKFKNCSEQKWAWFLNEMSHSKGRKD